MSKVAGTIQIKRRTTGAAGAPTTLLSGELFSNETTGLVYVGVGNDGNGNSTSQIVIGGQGLFASILLGQLLSQLPTSLPSTAGQAWLDGNVLSIS